MPSLGLGAEVMATFTGDAPVPVVASLPELSDQQYAGGDLHEQRGLPLHLPRQQHHERQDEVRHDERDADRAPSGLQAMHVHMDKFLDGSHGLSRQA